MPGCRVEVRDLETAQHEAAHVVVGCACGLRLRRALIGETREGRITYLGYAQFRRGGPPQGWVNMYAAGVAWDRIVGTDEVHSSIDMRLLRTFVHGRRDAEVAIRTATAMLAGLGREHARVTRALLERDITGADIAAICRGEHVDD